MKNATFRQAEFMEFFSSLRSLKMLQKRRSLTGEIHSEYFSSLRSLKMRYHIHFHDDFKMKTNLEQYNDDSDPLVKQSTRMVRVLNVELNFSMVFLKYQFGLLLI